MTYDNIWISSVQLFISNSHDDAGAMWVIGNSSCHADIIFKLSVNMAFIVHNIFWLYIIDIQLYNFNISGDEYISWHYMD